jgi:probable HAF family extracellular repeat protein
VCSGFVAAKRGFLCEGGDNCTPLSWDGQPIVPTALNDSGKITGQAHTPDGKSRAVVYSAGDVTDLGTLGGPVSGGLAVNSAGHVVGWSYDASYDSRAFLHDGQRMHDLNDLIPASSGWLLLSAAGINDAGQIVAQARKTGASGVFSVRLNPVSPAQRVAALVTLIESFGLPDGIETSFTKKLEHALAALEAGDTATACGDLQDFINHASAQSGKKLTVEQAGRIIAEAEAVRAALGCS